MILDATLNFVAIGSNFSLVGAAGVAIPSTNTIDLLGAGVGYAPPNIIGNVSTFGADTGVGDDRLLIQVNIGVAPTTSTSATLNVAFQGASDTAGTYQPGTWQTYDETGPMTVAQLPAGTVLRLDWGAAFKANARPRYLRLLFQVPTATNFTAGTISAAFPTFQRDDLANLFTPGNFVVR